jgi:hypothetical protein
MATSSSTDTALATAPEAERSQLKRLLSSGTRIMALYGLSVGMLLVAELLLSRSATAAEFGQYQYVRQSIPLVVGGVLFGLDQALTRQLAVGESFNVVHRIVARSAFWAVVVGVVVTACSLYAYKLSSPAVIALFSAPIVVVVSELAAAVLRARRHYGSAVLAQQGYRLIGGAAVILGLALGLPTDASPYALALGSILIGTWAAWRLTKLVPRGDGSPGEIRRLRVLGAGFGASMLSMALIDWQDQAAVAFVYGSLADSGAYAATKLAIVYPFVTVASVLGFMILPEVVRRRQLLTLALWRRALMVVTAGAAVLWLLGGLLSLAIAPLLIGRNVNTEVAFILAGVGVMRLMYLLPSSVVGAFGSARLLGWCGVAGFGAAGIGAASIFLMGKGDPLASGSIGLLVATALRLAIALWAGGRVVEKSCEEV